MLHAARIAALVAVTAALCLPMSPSAQAPPRDQVNSPVRYTPPVALPPVAPSAPVQPRDLQVMPIIGYRWLEQLDPQGEGYIIWAEISEMPPMTLRGDAWLKVDGNLRDIQPLDSSGHAKVRVFLPGGKYTICGGATLRTEKTDQSTFMQQECHDVELPAPPE